MTNSLRFKLIFFSFSSILLTLLIVGIAFDRLLDTQYQQKARSEIVHAYDSINSQIRVFEKSLLDQAHQIANNDSVIAATNLINKYQDTSNYQALIFDPEKKSIASYLLQQIIATPSDVAALYSKDGELLAFATQHRQNHIIGISSYQEGKQIILGKDEKTGDWLPVPLPENVSPQVAMSNDDRELHLDTSTLQYISNRNNFTLENAHPIIRKHPNGITETLGYVTLLKPLGLTFIENEFPKSETSVSILLANGSWLNPPAQLHPLNTILKQSQPMGSSTLRNMMILDHATYYLQSYVIPAANGEVYFFITLPKSDLNLALNQARTTLLMIFIFTAISATIFGVFWLNRIVSTPLQLLIHNAEKVEQGKASTLPVLRSNDEIGELSRVFNRMATAVKEREDELTNVQRTLKEAQHITKIGSWERDYISGKLYWSDEVYNILKLDPDTVSPYAEAIINTVHPDDRLLVQQTRINAQKKQGRCDFNYRMQFDGGEIKYIHERCEFHYSDEGRLISSSGTLQDITEQHDKEEILRRSQKMDALGQLTGGIAHDFNNMLGVILGFSELMMARVADDEKLTTYITNIHHAGERARNMTSKLLAFSRMKPLSADSTDINTLLQEQQHMLEKSLTARIELVLEFDPQLWPVYIEKGGLEDAVLNMSINAMHAMPEHGMLTIRTCNSHLTPNDAAPLGLEAGDYVLLSLIDSGTGMSEETMEHLFDPFYSTKGTKGTGLGMSQVYAFVRQSGGTIQVSSRLGHGTHIDIYFPRHIESHTQPSVEVEESNDLDLSGFETILIVDDEEGVLAFEYETLSSHGYHVLSASSGTQALDILAASPVDLIISDVIMPGMDGYQLAAKISDTHPEVKIILASGYTDESNKELVTDILHSTTLKKPFTSNVLLQHVRSALDATSIDTPLSMNIEWSDAYRTGIDEIDKDHKRLVSLVGRCQQAVKAGGDKGSITAVLNDLLDYTEHHFRREELLMEICNYPDISAHKQVHQQLIRQITERVQMHGNGTLTDESLLSLLRHWLTSHIAGMDRAITPYCKGKDELINKSLSNS